MIIGIHGKKQSGKDTVGNIIKQLIRYENYQIKKFADTLKDIVCILTDCTRDDLEQSEFKNKKLGAEWRKWLVWNDFTFEDIIFENEKKANDICTALYGNYNTESYKQDGYIRDVLYTYREMLQRLGTDIFREHFHPNTWINALMSKYKPQSRAFEDECYSKNVEYPNWIITDVRFPNEVKAIKDRNGLIIKIDRPTINNLTDKHESEIALDKYKDWDYIINNNSTIEELEKNVKKFIKIFELIL